MAIASVVDQKYAQAFADTLTLSSLFSNCVEALGLLLPYHEGKHTEEILLGKIAIQQARLLAWGDTVGVSSPPTSTGITHAIPKHPGLTNPDPNVPIYFGRRDPRLEDADLRTKVQDALNGISEPLLQPNGHHLKKLFGVQFYKPTRLLADSALLDVSRLEAFREKATLLEEVAKPYGNFARKRNRVMMYRYYIQDEAVFNDYLTVIRENIDFVIKLADVQPQVDKAMKMDLRTMGWHPSPDVTSVARMTWKLNVLRGACDSHYPEYSDAATEALDNVLGQWKGIQGYEALPDHKNPVIEQTILHSPGELSPKMETSRTEKTGFFHLRPKFLRKDQNKDDAGRRRSYDDSLVTKRSDPPRSNSVSAMPSSEADAEQELDPPRSKSVHAMTEQEFQKSHPEEALADLTQVPTNRSMIDRHDMYKGLFRTETKR